MGRSSQSFPLDPIDFQVLKRSIPVNPDLQLDPAAQESLQKGIQYLYQSQNRDGSWGSLEKTGITALALTALLEADPADIDREGLYRSVQFLKSQVGEAGRVLNVDSSSEPYAHAWTVYALLLAEEVGIVAEGDLTARKLLAQILSSQNISGFWGYGYKAGNRKNLSISYAQSKALLKAHRMGIDIEATGNALFTVASGSLHLQDAETGEFGYQLSGIGSMAMTGAGLSLLGEVGMAYHPAGLKALAILYGGELGWMGRLSDWPLYSMILLADSASLFRVYADQSFWPALIKELSANQQAEGQWLGPFKEAKYGEAYATALAVMVLQKSARKRVQPPPPSPFVWEGVKGESNIQVVGMMPWDESALYLYDPAFLKSLGKVDVLFIEPLAEEVLRMWASEQRNVKMRLSHLPSWMKSFESLGKVLQTTYFPPEEAMSERIRFEVGGHKREFMISPDEVLEALSGLPSDVRGEISAIQADSPIQKHWENLNKAWINDDALAFSATKAQLVLDYPQTMNWIIRTEAKWLAPSAREISHSSQSNLRVGVIVQAFWWEEMCEALRREGWR